MNSLKINLKVGQKVVMEGDSALSEEGRTVTIKDGFGMACFTSGTALFVEFVDGTTGRMDAMEIEKIAEEEIEEEEIEDVPCDRGCGGMMKWCWACRQFTHTCCVDYGTCQCS